MPGFDPTILRDEEKAGGFEPGFAGDETFKLEELPAYPGTVAATPPVEEPPRQAEVPAVEEPMAMEPQTTASIPDEPLPADEPSVAIPTAPVEAPIPVSEEKTPPTDPGAGSYSEPLVLDDSLIALLKEDLNKSKERRRSEDEAVAASRQPAADTIEHDSYAAAAAAAGEDEQQMEVDLSSIEADHPSTYGIEPPPPVVKEPTKTVQQDQPPKAPAKRRWKVSRTAVLALLLLLLLGGAAGGAYYYFVLAPGHDPAIAHHDSTATEHGAAEHATAAEGHHAAEGAAHSAEHGATPYHDMGHDTTAHGAAAAEPRQIPIDTAVIREHTGGVPPGTHAATPDQRVQQKTTNTGKTHSGAEAQQQTHAASSHGKAAGQHTTTAKDTKPLADHTAPAGHKSSSHEKTSRTAGKQSGTAAKSTALNQEYVIQVYASPSADDAEEWLGTLKKRNIPNGFVTSQSVRGQTWYRVRFGSFASREEAEQRANELGLSNIWVVRTR